MPTDSELAAARERAIEALGDDDNVTGIDVGFKYLERAHRRTDRKVVRLHVRRKIPSSRLGGGELFSQVVGDAASDVIRAEFRNRSRGADPDRTARNGVLRPGISVGHLNRAAGTLGAVVYQRDGRPAILSCWHVIGHPNPRSRRTRDFVFQPGTSDRRQAALRPVAVLSSMALWDQPDEDGDAATAALLPGLPFDPAQLGTGNGNGAAPAVVRSAREVTLADLGRKVTKSGRSTGVTRGLIDGVGRYFIDYGPPVGRVGIDGFKIVPEGVFRRWRELTLPGDSGAIYYFSDTLEGVGLHFEGERNRALEAEHGLACHLPRALRRLAVTLMP